MEVKLPEVFLGGDLPSFPSYFCRLRDKQYPSSRRAKTSRERQAAVSIQVLSMVTCFAQPGSCRGGGGAWMLGSQKRQRGTASGQ